MADGTYQPKVYRKQGAEELIIADSGLLAVEPGGDIDIQAGGTFSMATGGIFGFFGTNYTADQIKNFLRSNYAITRTSTSAATAALSGAGTSGNLPTLTPPYGYHDIALSTNASNTSCDIQSANLGDFLVICGANWGLSASLQISMSDVTTECSIYAQIDSGFSQISRIDMARGSASTEIPYLKMVCMTAGIWTVVEYSDNVTLVET